MKKELIKAKMVDAIYRHVVDTINGIEKGSEIVKGVYIIPNENEEDDSIWNNGCTVFSHDADKKVIYKLEDYFTTIGEMLEGGQEWLMNVANEIYDEFVETI